MFIGGETPKRLEFRRMSFIEYEIDFEILEKLEQSCTSAITEQEKYLILTDKRNRTIKATIFQRHLQRVTLNRVSNQTTRN